MTHRNTQAAIRAGGKLTGEQAKGTATVAQVQQVAEILRTSQNLRAAGVFDSSGDGDVWQVGIDWLCNEPAWSVLLDMLTGRIPVPRVSSGQLPSDEAPALSLPAAKEAAEPRDGESFTDYINRNRPPGAPKVSGAPIWLNGGENIGWEVDGWAVDYCDNGDKEQITWLPGDGAPGWYVLTISDGERTVEGGDWTPTSTEAA